MTIDHRRTSTTALEAGSLVSSEQGGKQWRTVVCLKPAIIPAVRKDLKILPGDSGKVMPRKISFPLGEESRNPTFKAMPETGIFRADSLKALKNPHLFRVRSVKRRQFLQLAASATLSGMALSSCGWTLAQVRPEAKGQGSSKASSKQLYIYTWSTYTDQDLLDRFTKETGFKIVADSFDSNEAMLARIQAGSGSAYSIIYPSDYMVQKMVELDMLTQLDYSRITGIDGLDPRFVNPEYDPGNLHSIPVSWGTTGLIYNKKKVQPPPEDWRYLWEHQQQLSKRISLLNDVREVIGATLKMLGYSYNSTNLQQVQQAYEKLAELKPSVASFTSDGWREQILSGDLLIAMCYSSDASEVIRENENLQYVIPQSGSSLWMDTLVIPKNAPNPEGAYAWINFLLKPDVSAQICERLSFATPNKAAFDQLPTKLKNNQYLFPPSSELKSCESVAPIGKFSEIYEKYWTQLTSA